MKRIRALLFCLLFNLLLCQSLAACLTQETVDPQDPAPETTDEPTEEFQKGELLPLKRIVMYNSGVGQMHHAGEVDGKTRLEIRFGGHDVNDVLKSLIFHDEGGGNARAVEYQPAPEPEDVAANQIGTPMTLAQLLQRFRGELVRLTVSGNEFKGTIYGVEHRTRKSETVETLVLMNDGGLQTIDLLSIDLVQFENEEIRNNLKLAMAGVVKSRKANQKQLDLLLDGEGKRDVNFAYVVDMPIWRMSYRLSTDGEESSFQGWAYVDNVTGVDWENVAIELRSGRPQAFHINMFSPILAERPAFGNSAYRFTKGLQLITEQFDIGKQFMRMTPEQFPGFGSQREEFDITRAFKSSAIEARASQMVQYELPELANIGAGKSASLPVFSETIPANFVSIYDDMDEKSIVYRAIQITNSTEYPFISGPISVVKDGDFVGDGHINRLNVGEDAEFIYAIDRAMEVGREEEEDDPQLRNIQIADGNVELEYSITTKVTFEIINKDRSPRSFRLRYRYQDEEFPKRELQAPDADEQADGIATFSVEVEQSTSKPFEIQLQRPSAEAVALESITQAQVTDWKTSGAEFEDGVQEFLDELIELQNSFAEWSDRLVELEKRKDNLNREQERARNNMEAVGPESEAAKFYIDQLQELEIEIQEVNTATKDTQNELDAVKKRRSDRIDQYGR